MKSPAKIAIMNVITVIALSIMAFVVVILLAQNRDLSKRIEEQTVINQRYLRCILLIPEREFEDKEKRVKAIDKCSLDSKLPDGQPVGEAPTSQEREQEATRQEAEAKETQRAEAPQPAAPAPKSDTAQTSQPETSTAETSQPEPTPQPTVVEQLINNVTGVL